MDNRVSKEATEENIELEWHYTPQNYFEKQISLEREGYSIDINAGRVTVNLTPDVFKSKPGLRDSITQHLNDYFLGAQPIRRQPFEIKGAVINHVWPDGRRDTTMVLESSARRRSRGGEVDLIHTKQDGTVYDSRRHRIDAIKTLAERSTRHAADPTVRRILDSFDAAVRDPNNELVHLFEVWEALIKRFGDGENARQALGISIADRRRLGRLSNDEPLNQGRHRGRHAGDLRDATEEELNEARLIAQEMVTSYLEHLDK